MKYSLITVCHSFVVSAMLGLGCATTSTVQKRIQERSAAYAQLSPEHRAKVDRGELEAGMSEDAVFMAIGKPSQVLRGGSAAGLTTTWLYEGLTTDTYHYWTHRAYPGGRGRSYYGSELATDYDFRSYISAEMVFRDGKLESWRMLPRPGDNSHFSPTPYFY